MSFLATAGRLVDRIKINTLTRSERGGRAVWTKRRRASARVVIPLANRFFRLAGNPVTILGDVGEWHAREIASMRMLHGDEFSAWSDASGALHVEELPGMSISAHLDAGTETDEMFAAAASEFRRAHTAEDGWSHGDPHSGNVIFDAKSGRARLMDFEVLHDATLCAEARHADDLLVFLQDTLGRLPRGRWLELAGVFVRGYECPQITARLSGRLSKPRGMACVWWAVRTTYLAPAELAWRLDALREVLGA